MTGIEEETFIVFGILLSIGAGALSFLSPCVLPIFPAYLSYITGISVKDIQEYQNKKVRKQLLSHSLFFLLGVSLIFISFGIGAAFLGNWLYNFLEGDGGLLVQRIAGIFIIFMGLFVAGWIQLPSLMKDRRFRASKKPAGYLGTFFVGLGFAAGWTPCIGPIFSSILALGMTNPAHVLIYTSMYVVGFALPFLLLTFFIGSTKWIVKYSGIVMKVGGVIMIIMGGVLFSGLLPEITRFLLGLIEGTWLEYLG